MPTTDDRVERVAQLLDEWWARNQGCDLKTWLADHHVVALAPGEVVVPHEPTEAMNRAAASSYARTTGASETVPMYAALCAAIEAGEDKAKK